MDGVALHRPLAHGWREVPVHALMLGVMVPAMIVQSTVVSVLGAVTLVAASIVCAALSRSRPFLREHVVDLWAMALLLLVYLPAAGGVSSAHGHGVAVSHDVAFAAVLVGWLGARVWLLRQQSAVEWRMPVASAAVTAAGLIAMAAFCS